MRVEIVMKNGNEYVFDEVDTTAEELETLFNMHTHLQFWKAGVHYYINVDEISEMSVEVAEDVE